MSRPPRTTEVTKDNAETAEMNDYNYDFSKINLTNALTPNSGHPSNPIPLMQ